ncbi:uncharacterized protein [Ciconia boyciana]|uniref:uncharacterized protein n=1 Tax=Ciconia boyciana TaxID=52775 RepID=UPI003BA238F3
MGQANCCCGSREALTDIEPVLSADVRLTRGRKRSERRLLLLREELLMAKLQGGTSLRPQLRLALDQLWVLSGGKEAAGQEEEEAGSDEDRTTLIFIWPTGSCIADFGSRALKELWVGTLLGTPEGAKRARVTRLPSLKLLEKELSRRHAWRTVSVRSLERLMEGQAEADPKQGPPPVPAGNGGDFAAHQVGQPKGGRQPEEQGHPLGSGRWTWLSCWLSCSGKGRRRRAYSAELPAGRRRELREALDRGADVDLGSQPALLLAVVLKVSASDLQLEELLPGLERSKAQLEPLALQDFLRSIPSKLLVNDLYEDWMAAMQKSSKEEKIEELKAVAEKLPAANLLLLKRLLSLLQHIGRNAATSRMTPSNLAICVGPNLLSPANEDLLPLEAMLEVAEKVKVLLEFLMENCRELFGEETTELSCAAAEESPASPRRSRDLPLEEQSVPAVPADSEHQAEALPHAPLLCSASPEKLAAIRWWSVKRERCVRSPNTVTACLL